jgi:hypothetical protein
VWAAVAGLPVLLDDLGGFRHGFRHGLHELAVHFTDALQKVTVKIIVEITEKFIVITGIHSDTREEFEIDIAKMELIVITQWQST